jgi:hypothetical protein
MSKVKKDMHTALEARLMAPLTWWAEFLGLAQLWDINITIVDSIPGAAADGHKALAEVTVQYPYRRALIEVDADIQDYSEQGVERCMLHELMHIVFADLNGYIHRTGRPGDMDALHNYIEDLCDATSFALMRLKHKDDYKSITIQTEVNR